MQKNKKINKKMLLDNIERKNYFKKNNIMRKNSGISKNPNMFVIFMFAEELFTKIKVKKQSS